jgi:addiction module HigA family antidote
MTEKLPNVHPGEILLKEFLEPMGIGQNRLAREISVPLCRLNEIILGKQGISLDTALRFARCLVPLRDSGSGCRRILIWRIRGFMSSDVDRSDLPFEETARRRCTRRGRRLRTGPSLRYGFAVC